MTKKSYPEKSKQWRLNNPEKIRAYKQRYSATHKAEERIRRKKYYKENRAKILAQHKDSWERNRETKIAVSRARRAANPEKYRELQRSHKVKNPGSWRLYGIRKSAKQAGVACDIDLQWIESRLNKGICELSGLPFDGGKRTPNSASVDRKDPKGPYTKENCRMIIWWLNRALSNLGEDYALSVFRAIFINRGEIAERKERAA